MRASKEIRYDIPVDVSTSYDPNKTTIGPLIHQKNEDSEIWIGPKETLVSRSAETIGGGFSQFPNIVKWSDNIYWIVSSQQSTGGTTLRLMLWQYKKNEHVLSWKGQIAYSGPGGTMTNRGVKPSLQRYTTGTASVSGTAVTGVGTAWADTGQCVGSRIGFGSTDPTQISTWYEISAVGSNTSITIALDAGTISSGSYVIEDFRVYLLMSNSTPTNGGVFVIKGLRPELFLRDAVTASPTIAIATTVDNTRAVYWLADAATVTHTAGWALAKDEFIDWTTERLYANDPSAGTAVTCFVYNGRAPLTGLSAGKSTAAFLFKTASIPSGVGTGNATSIATIATANHGPGKGKKSYYFATAQMILRAELSGITSGAEHWISDSLREVPPGGVNTYVLQGSLGGVVYEPITDRFLFQQTGTTVRPYFTRYDTRHTPFDHILWGDTRQMDGINADSTGVPHANTFAQNHTDILDGIAFTTRQSAIGLQAQQYIYPLLAHWRYADITGNAVITPKISISDARRMYKLYVSDAIFLGGSTNGMSTAGYRVFFRVQGIDDNSGAWHRVNYQGDLEGIYGNFIQFKIEFRTMGIPNITSRIYGLTVTYETEDPLPDRYMWNFGDSSINQGIFGFAQVALWNMSIPVHTIQIFRGDNNALVLEQASNDNTLGVFENWNGSTWVTGLGTDTLNKRMRFRPTASLPAGVSLYAKIIT